LCLAEWLPAANAAGHCWPRLSCKENEHGLTDENASLCDPPHNTRVRAWRLHLVSAGIQALGLFSPTLLDRNLPGFSSLAKAYLPAMAGAKVLLQI